MIVCKNCDAKNPSDNAFCENCGEPLGSTDTIGGLETPMYTGPSTKRSPTPSTELEPGAVFADRYTIVEKLGQGGMGTVYKATETLAGKDRAVALKLIRADRLADQRAIDKLVSEGVLTQDIRHPNVVNVYNVGVHEGQPFVAMELVKGVSLREWHRRQIGAGQDVSTDTAAAIVWELLGGLEAAHNLDIIHRDLKPENIMLTAEPEGAKVKLQILDFGIARTPGTVETGTGIGTPHYMAPEQITNPDSAGPPADFYSVFKIWYELLMDVLPQGHWQPPSTGRPDVLPMVDALIERGLSAKPSRRPQDVAHFRKWLHQAMPDFAWGGGGVGPTPAPSPIPPQPSPVPFNIDVKKIGTGAAIGVGALLVLAVLGGDDEPEYVDDTDDPEEVIAWDDLDIDPEEEVPDGPGTITPDPVETFTPPPPPPRVTYSDLSGTWMETDSSGFQISVAPNGGFRGGGFNANGPTVPIEGNISTGGYVVGSPIGFLQGSVTWDGAGCHLNYRTLNPNGTVYAQGQWHVNHNPGGPCPAGFGQ